MPTSTTSSRLHVVDALRGFAIVTILLLHNLEHFDLYHLPANLPVWMVSLDKGVWDTLFFIFAGKSYAIFALLFGLTFFIQSNNQEKKGKDFRGRFAWRLLLLFGFGLINSSFYQGDILTIYAILGFLLIPVARWSDRAVLITAGVLLLQPFQWGEFFVGLSDPGAKLADPASWKYFGKMGEYITGSSFIDTVVGNLTNGKLAVYNWSWEAGRAFQAPALFMLGMLAGRKRLFVPSEQSNRFWRRTLLWALAVYAVLYGIRFGMENSLKSEALRRPLLSILTTWVNFSLMLVLVGGFTLLFQKERFHRFLNLFTLLGRMSLSNYVMQSIMGSFVYYGFGLGLYLYTGATYSLLIAIGLVTIQWLFCRWWLNRHKQGPLEYLWHKATWIRS